MRQAHLGACGARTFLSAAAGDCRGAVGESYAANNSGPDADRNVRAPAAQLRHSGVALLAARPLALRPTSYCPNCAILALLCLLPALAAVAQVNLYTNALSREFSIFVGGEQTPLVKDIASREVSLFVGADGLSPYPEAVSREFSLLMTTPAVPQQVSQLTVSVSPMGDTAA